MRLVTILALFTCLLSAGGVRAEDSPRIQSGASITVTVPAERVRLVVGVSARADRAKDAAARVAATLNGVRDALVKLGLDRNNLPSAGYVVNADYNDPNKSNGYLASSSLSVELSNLGLLGAVVDTALGAGANQVSDIRFLPRDEESARARALELAVQRARRDAEVLAKASGTKLGSLLLLTTQRVSNFGVVETMRVMDSATKTTDIPAPEISITAYVQGEWQIIP